MQTTCPKCLRTFPTRTSMGGHIRKCGVTHDELFWSKVNKMDDCWLWTGAKNNYGYGMFAIQHKKTLCHRHSWVLANGPIPAGLLVLHKCDTPLCLRPDHLFLGTDGDNARDMASKGRRAVGERCPRRKLSAAQAREILSLKGQISGCALAPKYGAHPGAIHAIWRGDAWAHLGSYSPNTKQEER